MFRTMMDSSYQAMNAVYEENNNTLYLGDCTAAFDRATLDVKNVKTVLTVAAGLMVNYPDGGITHKTYNILDVESANISRFFTDTFQMIADGLKKGSVLVHCAAGVSRSASVTIAFMMRLKGMSFQEAMNYVKRKRQVICPNYGFQRQLRQFENDLRQKKQKEQKEQHQAEMPPPLEIVAKAKEIPQQTQVTTPNKKNNEVHFTHQKDNRLTTQFKQEQKKFNTTYSNRSNSTQPKFLIASQYNSSYTGPQIVTHQKNKLYDKSEKKPFNMPGITFKGTQYPVYKRF
ncbi:hypothetical protein pb186bvf_013352 [Paramecium bursaria]